MSDPNDADSAASVTSGNFVSIHDAIWLVFEESVAATPSRCTADDAVSCFAPTVNHSAFQNYSWWFNAHAATWLEGNTHAWANADSVVCICIGVACVFLYACIQQARVSSLNWTRCKDVIILSGCGYCLNTPTAFCDAPADMVSHVDLCVSYDVLRVVLPAAMTLDLLFGNRKMTDIGCAIIRLIGWDACLQLGTPTVVDNSTLQLSLYVTDTVTRVWCACVWSLAYDDKTITNLFLRASVRCIHNVLSMGVFSCSVLLGVFHIMCSFGLWENIAGHSNQFSLAGFVFLWANFIQTIHRLLSSSRTKILH
jgi:hypothetical protein